MLLEELQLICFIPVLLLVASFGLYYLSHSSIRHAYLFHHMHTSCWPILNIFLHICIQQPHVSFNSSSSCHTREYGRSNHYRRNSEIPFLVPLKTLFLYKQVFHSSPLYSLYSPSVLPGYVYVQRHQDLAALWKAGQSPHAANRGLWHSFARERGGKG